MCVLLQKHFPAYIFEPGEGRTSSLMKQCVWVCGKRGVCVSRVLDDDRGGVEEVTKGFKHGAGIGASRKKSVGYDSSFFCSFLFGLGGGRGLEGFEMLVFLFFSPYEYPL